MKLSPANLACLVIPLFFAANAQAQYALPAAPLDFGDVTIGAPVVQSVTITHTSNVQGDDTTLSSIAVTGAGFALLATGTCAAVPFNTVAVNATCTVDIQITGAAEGALAGNLAIGWDANTHSGAGSSNMALAGNVPPSVIGGGGGSTPPERIPTMSAYGLVLTMLGLLVVAGRRLRSSARRD